MTERSILLNGQELKVSPDEELPDLIPVITEPSNSLTISAYGMTFWVLIQPDVGYVCKTKKNNFNVNEKLSILKNLG